MNLTLNKLFNKGLRIFFNAVFSVCFSYDNLDVPDTMNVHGIYDTGAFMIQMRL